MLATNAPTIGDLVVNRPELADLFDSLGIDFCCGGRRSLEEACLAAGLHYPTVLERVQSIQARTPAEEPHQTPSLAELCLQIVERHHAYLRSQMPLIARQLEKVIAAHVGRHPELARLKKVFETFAAELRSHMAKEEQVLFPAITRMEQTGMIPTWPFGSIHQPIAAMEREHADAGDELGTMRALTGGFVPPPDACTTYRALLALLLDLERDMHLHVHLENNILFPAAMRMEEDLHRQGSRSGETTESSRGV